MSEPKHIYGQFITAIDNYSVGTFDTERDFGDLRYTLTDGDEYRALIERARTVSDPAAAVFFLHRLLCYLEGEQ